MNRVSCSAARLAAPEPTIDVAPTNLAINNEVEGRMDTIVTILVTRVRLIYTPREFTTQPPAPRQPPVDCRGIK